MGTNKTKVDTKKSKNEYARTYYQNNKEAICAKLRADRKARPEYYKAKDKIKRDKDKELDEFGN